MKAKAWILVVAVCLAVTFLILQQTTNGPGNRNDRRGGGGRTEVELSTGRKTSPSVRDDSEAMTVANAEPDAPRTTAAGVGGSQMKPYRLVGHTGNTSFGTVRVLVVDETGSPRAGASVKLTKYVLGRQAACVERKTGADGQVEIREFPSGKPQLAVRLGSVQRIATVELVDGRVTEATVVIPRTGASIEGNVRRRHRGSLNGATVTLEGRGEWFADYLHARTGLDGRYRFEAVLPNIYRVVVRAPTLDRARKAGDITVVGSDAVRRDIEIGVLSLSGVVRDSATRRPLRDVTVQLQEPEPVTCRIDTEGRYRFYDISAGEGRLVLDKEGYELLFVDAGTIVVGEERELDIELHPAAVLHLHVADDQGRPVTGALRLIIVDRNDPTATSISTGVTAGANGHAVYKKIRPGSYELAIRQGGSQWPAAEFEVHAGDNTIHFRLPTKAEQETPMLAGTVRDAATGLPIPSASVRVRGCGAKTETDDRGNFDFLRLPSSDQKLVIEKDGYGYALVRAANLAEGKTREVDIELKPGATLRLSIKTRKGLRAPRKVQLVFLPPKGQTGPTWGATLRLDDAGCASYRCVPPGKYMLLVLGGLGAARLDLDVGLGETSIEVRLE